MRTVCTTLVITAAILATRADAIIHDKGYGEPYDVRGKRIVFTNWYWVRPGQMDWQDDSGKSVFADRSVMAGPFDSHFVNIDGPWGVRLIAEDAQRGGKLEIKPEHPWEAQGITITKMLPTPQGKIMAWGTCAGEDGRERTCYLESSDGLNWTRARLGLLEYNGSNDNNLTPGGPNGHVFIDPTAPPEERFKSASNSDLKLNNPEDAKRFEEYKKRRPWQVMATETDPGRVHAIFGFVSPDGIQWRQLEDPLSIEISDGDQSVYWDADLKKYVMYARTYFVGSRPDGYPLKHERRHQFIGRRAIGRSEGATFREFDLSEIIIDTRSDMAPTDTYYLNCYTWIPGAPSHHLMFVSRYIQAEDKTAIDLYASCDGKRWHEAPGSPLLETATFGEFDGGCLFTYPHLIERAGADGRPVDWVLLYRGDNFPHKYPRGKQESAWGTAVWPKGRLMAIEAPLDGGFTTPAFLLPGQKLRINALTSRVGEIRVEVADFYGKTLPGRSFDDCRPIIGDQYRVPVTWKDGDTLGAKNGEPVVLRFKMSRAKIYQLDFE
jgi:hypothetical protein